MSPTYTHISKRIFRLNEHDDDNDDGLSGEDTSYSVFLLALGPDVAFVASLRPHISFRNAMPPPRGCVLPMVAITRSGCGMGLWKANPVRCYSDSRKLIIIFLLFLQNRFLLFYFMKYFLKSSTFPHQHVKGRNCFFKSHH